MMASLYAEKGDLFHNSRLPDFADDIFYAGPQAMDIWSSMSQSSYVDYNYQNLIIDQDCRGGLTLLKPERCNIRW